jgi:hypothetical protein
MGLMILALRPVIAAWYRFQADSCSPSSQVVLLAKASSWQADPNFAFQSALALCMEAQKSSAQRRVVLLREALSRARSAWEEEPYNHGFGQLVSSIILQLDRPDDSQQRPPANRGHYH